MSATIEQFLKPVVLEEMRTQATNPSHPIAPQTAARHQNPKADMRALRQAGDNLTVPISAKPTDKPQGLLHD